MSIHLNHATTPALLHCGQGFEFKEAEIRETVERKGLLSLVIVVNAMCSNDRACEQELSSNHIDDVVRQACQLGAKKIILMGIEPMIHPGILSHISHIHSLGMGVEMITGGMGIDLDRARFLLDRKVKVVLLVDTLKSGLSPLLKDALFALEEAGYPSSGLLLASSTVITQINRNEIGELLGWAREKRIEPRIKMGFYPSDLSVDACMKIASPFVDTPHPPFLGSNCLCYSFSMTVYVNGEVRACVGLPIVVGNICHNTLRSILHDSEVMEDLRNFNTTIKGPCGECDRVPYCSGCRGSAYHVTGDYLASDPFCWFNKDRLSEITSLPVSVKGYVPQERPMRIIDRIVSIGDRKATMDLTVPDRGPFITEKGELDRTFYPEVVAQASAALNGYRSSRKKAHPKGMLLGIKYFSIFKTAESGDRLTASIYKAARFGEFGIIEGTVSKENEVFAKGEIKIWHSE